jgi:hypothetical protein
VCRDAANIGARPQLQYDLAKANYTTVVSQYEQQLKLTPACVRNTTWLKGINSSINSILKPTATNNSSTGEVLLDCSTAALQGVSGAPLLFHYVHLVSCIAACQSLARARFLFSQQHCMYADAATNQRLDNRRGLCGL